MTYEFASRIHFALVECCIGRMIHSPQSLQCEESVVMNSPLLVCWCNRCCNIAKLPEFFPRWLNWRNMTGMQCCGQGIPFDLYICVLTNTAERTFNPSNFETDGYRCMSENVLNLDRYSFLSLIV